jgi:nucleoside-diphosphate-sugar epimerase
VRFATGRDGEAEMSLIFVEDTVGFIHAIFLAIDHPFKGIFHIGTNQAADT